MAIDRREQLKSVGEDRDEWRELAERYTRVIMELKAENAVLKAENEGLKAGICR